jgi:hypothetical protein
MKSAKSSNTALAAMETSISFCREMRAFHHCGSSVFAVSGHVLSAFCGQFPHSP